MKPKKTVLFCLIIGISCLPGCQKGDDSDTNAIPFTIDFEQRSPTPGAIDLAPDLTFEWTQSQRAVKFELHYGETPDANDVIIKNITTNSYSVTGLTFGARYYWKIVGVDSQRRTASTVTWNFDIKTNFFELNSAFEIPQLNRTTSIWMYLPPDYDSGANQYPVLYMLEGELAFAPAVGAIVGEWHVDETLDQLFKEKGLGVIVVAIANHNNHNGDRCDETLPWVVSNDIEAICREASGPHGGLAEGYLNFIAKTLKPYIDNNYRTYSKEAKTVIMGSGLGGVLAFYAGLKEPGIFGRIGIFSPAFWFTGDRIYELAEQQKTLLNGDKIYFFHGNRSRDSYDIPGDIQRMIDIIGGEEFVQVQSKSLEGSNFEFDDRNGSALWGAGFPDAIEWLLEE